MIGTVYKWQHHGFFRSLLVCNHCQNDWTRSHHCRGQVVIVHPWVCRSKEAKGQGRQRKQEACDLSELSPFASVQRSELSPERSRVNCFHCPRELFVRHAFYRLIILPSPLLLLVTRHPKQFPSSLGSFEDFLLGVCPVSQSIWRRGGVRAVIRIVEVPPLRQQRTVTPELAGPSFFALVEQFCRQLCVPVATLLVTVWNTEHQPPRRLYNS